MRCNHLGCFLHHNYPDKITMLSRVGLSIPKIIHELIIDPGNDVEHSYTPLTEERAAHAVELAGLFLQATSDERAHQAIISINWSVSVRHS
jgi:hypothetical protein